MANLSEKERLRPDEVAKILECSRSTIYRYVNTGLLQAVRIGPRKMWIIGESVRECQREVE